MSSEQSVSADDRRRDLVAWFHSLRSEGHDEVDGSTFALAAEWIPDSVLLLADPAVNGFLTMFMGQFAWVASQGGYDDLGSPHFAVGGRARIQ